MNAIKKFVASLVNSNLKARCEHFRVENSRKDRRISALETSLREVQTQNLLLQVAKDNPTMNWVSWDNETPFQSHEGRASELILVFSSGKKLMAQVVETKREIRLETMFGDKVSGTPVAWMALAVYQ